MVIEIAATRTDEVFGTHKVADTGRRLVALRLAVEQAASAVPGGERLQTWA